MVLSRRQRSAFIEIESFYLLIAAANSPFLGATFPCCLGLLMGGLMFPHELIMSVLFILLSSSQGFDCPLLEGGEALLDADDGLIAAHYYSNILSSFLLGDALRLLVGR